MNATAEPAQKLDLLARELKEAREQQTAISDILRVISNSPGDVQPVFDAVAERAARICEAPFADIIVVDAGMVRLAANVGGLGPYDPGRAIALDRTTFMGRSICDKQTLHVADLQSPDLDFPLGRQLAIKAGARTALAVPLIRDDRALGTILVRRTEVRPFEDKHIALLKTFADQAAIAIENARLLNDLRQRTDSLSEALEQQTAISDILRVIASSPGKVKPVFDSVAEHAARICEAPFVGIVVVKDGMIRPTVNFGQLGGLPAGEMVALDRTTVMGRSICDKQPVHVADLMAAEHDFPLGGQLALRLGHRSILSVPLIHEGHALGAIVMRRTEVRPFEDKHIALLKTFADQAAIAIENARLLREVRQQAGQLEAQSQELRTLNQQLEQRVDEQVGEIERMSRLRRFLPPQVADLIVSSGNEKLLESHRREITALFCDLRGFTGFSETSDPEDVMALLREYHKAIGEIIFRHGGTLERFAGDGVMVIFGDPVPLPNPALSAVQMALEMRAAIGALIDQWSRLGHELGFGIGLAHGYATLGTIGFEGRFDYAAIGTVSNVASRLCDEAQPGQILVSPRVLLAVGNAVAVEPVREMTLKGIRRPMLVHNVVAAATKSGSD